MTKIPADKNWVTAIAINDAIKGDSTLLEKLQQEHIDKMINDSMADIKAGRTRDAKQAIDEIAKKFGLVLEHKKANHD